MCIQTHTHAHTFEDIAKKYLVNVHCSTVLIACVPVCVYNVHCTDELIFIYLFEESDENEAEKKKKKV